MHFQFNGLLLGILLISVGSLRRTGVVWTLAGGAAFGALLVMKHLFLPMAPVFFVFLLAGFCRPGGSFRYGRFCALGLVVLCIMVLPFVPLVVDHSRALNTTLAEAASVQLRQIGGRLFPFVAEASGGSECQGDGLAALPK